MALREMNSSSIHWGGYSGMKLAVNPFDPLPSSLLGGIDVDDFLQDQLSNSLDPLAAGLGLLYDSSSGAFDDSTLSTAWSVRDPNPSFYEEVFDLIFSTPGPALPSDALRYVPRFIEQDMVARGVQCVSRDAPPADQSEFQTVAQVCYNCVCLF